VTGAPRVAAMHTMQSRNRQPPPPPPQREWRSHSVGSRDFRGWPGWHLAEAQAEAEAEAEGERDRSRRLLSMALDHDHRPPSVWAAAAPPPGSNGGGQLARGRRAPPPPQIPLPPRRTGGASDSRTGALSLLACSIRGVGEGMGGSGCRSFGLSRLAHS
jgi:hypothetical protein